jgi:hypothetical protein
MPGLDLKRLPETVKLHLVDICEIAPPKGAEPIHWRLLTSHVVEDCMRRLHPIDLGYFG